MRSRGRGKVFRYILPVPRAAYIVEGLRTPFGRHGGALSEVRADDLLAHVFREICQKTQVQPEEIDDVIAGCANQAGEDNRNVARMAVLLAGLPVEVPGVTVNRLCGSGMQAFADAARQIQLGEADIVIAGGVEQMTRSPLVMSKGNSAFARGDRTIHDTTLGWRFVNPKLEAKYDALGMGLTAEKVAAKYNVSREAQDDFAFESQQRCKRAMDNGTFAREVVPIQTGVERKTKAPILFETDEHPRPEIPREKFSKLPTVFDRQNGTVTPGNASGLNDGACAMLIASEDAIKRYGWTPLARYVTCAAAGVEPNYMGMGPVPSSQKALARAGWKTNDIDLAEINEAFAAQAIPCLGELELDPALVNVNGGAIALGHPLGASGARIVLTLAHEMAAQNKSKGLAAMCIGVGQGIATLLER